jgi:rhodanese-related sulfurtransferase
MIMKTIGPQDFQATAERSLLVDVRTPAEYEEVHIEGSLLHPLTQLKPEEIRKAAGNRGVCVVCRTGSRSRQGAEKLEAAGIGDVQVLEGGVQGWAEAGLPVKRGRKTMSLERQVRVVVGAMVLLGAVLGWFVHPAWIGLSAFFGAGLLFAGVTDWCGLAMMLARMPWNNLGAVRSCDVPAGPDKG